ncbi:hypothetical protein, partial [Pontixanthobacter sp.]|uniref:hypothetical protein n=1 Tax=Pontixanthobacter sp. TaxID=2792078 RepID=UPI003C7B1460
PAGQRNAHGLLLELFCMLLHLVGLLARVLNSQVTGTKPLQVQIHISRLVITRFAVPMNSLLNPASREIPLPVLLRQGQGQQRISS